MVEIPRAKYVETRRNKDGSERFIWNRKGFPAHALPDDWTAAMVEAQKLNNQAERGLLKPKSGATLDQGVTLARYLDLYERGDVFKALASQTRANYRSAMKTLRETFPTQKMAAFQKRQIKRFLETIDSIGMRRICKSVLRSVFEMALDDELIDRNPADNIQLPTVKPRRALWSSAQIDAFTAKCDLLDQGDYPAGRAEAMRRRLLSPRAHGPAAERRAAHVMVP